MGKWGGWRVGVQGIRSPDSEVPLRRELPEILARVLNFPKDVQWGVMCISKLGVVSADNCLPPFVLGSREGLHMSRK